MVRAGMVIPLLAVSLTCTGTTVAHATHRGTFAKGMPPLAGSAARHGEATPGATTSYHYVYDHADGTASGASGDFLVAQPAVPPPDVHSLAEIAVESADGQQIVEEGWTVDPAQFGDSHPRLFVFHWVDGEPTCYNGCGFVAQSVIVTPGMALTPGDEHVFKINHSHGRWNISDGDVHVGYFPDSLWSGGFTEGGLTQWFGEVAATGTPPCAQMGNGLFATDPSADSISKMKLVHGAAVSATPVKTDPADYTGKATAPNAMRFGGPGGCGPQPQIISFISLPPSNAVVGGRGYAPSAVGGGSGNPVVFSIAASSVSVCTIEDTDVSFIGPGRCVVQADQDGNAAFTPAATATQKFRVRLAQTVAFASHPPRSANVGGKVYVVKTRGGQSGKPVVISAARSAKSVCVVHRRRVSFIGHGECVIRANQAGTSTYAPAHQVTQRFHVSKH